MFKTRVVFIAFFQIEGGGEVTVLFYSLELEQHRSLGVPAEQKTKP